MDPIRQNDFLLSRGFNRLIRMSLPKIDETHDPHLRTWVDGADGHTEFPLQNLPLGRMSLAGEETQACIAIGDFVVRLKNLLDCGLLSGDAEAAAIAACRPSGSAVVGLRPAHRVALRRAVSNLLRVDTAAGQRARQLSPQFLIEAAACDLHLPARIPNFTDFNAGIHHAANGGRRRGLKDPLLPNYRHLPIAYHSRASSVQLSGKPVFRPWGQWLPEGEEIPVFAPSRRLDFELELGIWVGRGNALGEPIDIANCADHIAGYCLINDWSARDIQSWESQRLGPFLGKSFCTTISPWIISPEALAPFRGPGFERGQDHPRALPYLEDPVDAREGMPQLQLSVLVSANPDSDPVLISRSHTRHLFWTPAQMLAHHASNGCNLQAGDLFGSGTITGDDPQSFGTFLDAPTPRFMCDGEQLILRAHAVREGYVSIGFGDCMARIEPAKGAK
ncbi:fumarylacetoacetase [Acidovorax delafieldii]|uniref:fumarylacetoacetase n=1 Tax=Acidovorax delafieldii TaxID=47920 RepID=UPI0028632705|nr:fumarylacetoacetase [Acidovorax delafieldii]MDR6155568.1 fumarylacetoacetase [Acidovorax delafieldii]